MKKKKNFTLPTVTSNPNTMFALCGGLLGLALILCIEPKEEKFVPAYTENSNVTQTWDENEAVVLAGTVDDETEGTLKKLPEVTIDPEEEIPEADGDNGMDVPKENPEQNPRNSEKDDVVENQTELEENSGKEPIVKPEYGQPEDSAGGNTKKNEDTQAVPDTTTSNTETDTPEEVIHFTENVTKEDMADTKPKEKPATKDNTKNPDEKPEYSDDVPEAGEPETGTAGKVYDPVFGWITTGEAVSDNIDNDGSLDKQVGTMGK